MSQEIAVQKPQQSTRIQTFDPVDVMDTARFEHMQRIATIMARGTLIPSSLCKEKDPADDTGKKELWLPESAIIANCFRIVNQSVRWGMDPFAVLDCASLVHGKLCWEGKLIAAVIDAKLGIKLKYTWNDKTGDALAIVVSGTFPDTGETKTVEGTVGEWKTKQWGGEFKKRLAYRGAREWARLHAPATMLGVYTIDEMMGVEELRGQLRVRGSNYAIVSNPLSDEEPAHEVKQITAQEVIETDATKANTSTPHDADGVVLEDKPNRTAADELKAGISETIAANADAATQDAQKFTASRKAEKDASYEARVAKIKADQDARAAEVAKAATYVPPTELDGDNLKSAEELAAYTDFEAREMAAYEFGVKARKKGMTKKAMPQEYLKLPEMQIEHDAWLNGFDDASK
jgi:hypothetical protein